MRHECSESATHLDHPFLEQRAIGVLHGVRIQLQVDSELPCRRQGLARFQDADRNRPGDLVRNLAIRRARVVALQFNEHFDPMLAR